METNFQQEPKVPFFQTTTAKMIMVGILTLVLIIPLALVQELIVERSQRQKEVITETTAKWGNSVYFYGPILKVPYKDPMSGANNYAYFFPETLNNKTEVTMVKPLERSIYKSNVFTTKMQFDGNYTNLNFASKGIPAENIYWNRAKILIRTTNLKSLKDEVKMKIGNQNLAFESVASSSNDSIESLETNYFDYQNLQNEAKFNFTISFNGSKQVKMVPIGKTTDAKMTSNWNSPNFNGNFSPISRNITDNGFEANWKILHFNRPFAQSYFDILPELGKYAFAVDFITPVDEYQQSERASKYGFLVIGLTFLIFFLIQSISKINIHIFQYSMIGIALIMFYTLLISITEHSSFSFAYLVAGASVIVMISIYSISILKDKKFPMFIGASLSVLYTFIYVIIQLEDYALLVGSIGLFLILAAVMYFSRKIEWNK
ncbi:cell envelope integrity protein CreD [Flavobacterium proteolyticum]|uniref:Cell envelope integrity protein CreD n=1 Tax=Flavobacterium proteolyticum TaxID=2911683 RepID=A0ABR9WSE6_9FLAO|nr:cell envelope integrity protein CreD [Flavobacterium proteolyticum]MBE9576838.1 cell envelope integrity protein CreD [Flavobacterium proteolyticum]